MCVYYAYVFCDSELHIVICGYISTLLWLMCANSRLVYVWSVLYVLSMYESLCAD